MKKLETIDLKFARFAFYSLCAYGTQTVKVSYFFRTNVTVKIPLTVRNPLI